MYAGGIRLFDSFNPSSNESLVMSPYLLSWLPLRYLTIFFIIKSHMIHLL